MPLGHVTAAGQCGRRAVTRDQLRETGGTNRDRLLATGQPGDDQRRSVSDRTAWGRPETICERPDNLGTTSDDLRPTRERPKIFASDWTGWERPHALRGCGGKMGYHAQPVITHGLRGDRVGASCQPLPPSAQRKA